MRKLIFIFSFISCKNDDYDNLSEPLVENYTPGCPDVQFPSWGNSNYLFPYPINSSYIIGLSSCTTSYHAAGQPD